MAQPRGVRIVGCRSFVISIKIAPAETNLFRPVIRSGLLTQGGDSELPSVGVFHVFPPAWSKRYSAGAGSSFSPLATIRSSPSGSGRCSAWPRPKAPAGRPLVLVDKGSGPRPTSRLGAISATGPNASTRCGMQQAPGSAELRTGQAVQPLHEVPLRRDLRHAGSERGGEARAAHQPGRGVKGVVAIGPLSG